MKTLLTILYTLLVITVTHAQSTIIGKWKLDWDSSYSAMSNEEHTKFQNMPDAVRADAIKSFSKRVFDFKNNHTVEITWEGRGGERTETGTWQLEGSVLTITVNDVAQQYMVDIGGNTLGLTKIGGAGVLSKMIFNRK